MKRQDFKTISRFINWENKFMFCECEIEEFTQSDFDSYLYMLKSGEIDETIKFLLCEYFHHASSVEFDTDDLPRTTVKETINFLKGFVKYLEKNNYWRFAWDGVTQVY